MINGEVGLALAAQELMVSVEEVKGLALSAGVVERPLEVADLIALGSRRAAHPAWSARHAGPRAQPKPAGSDTGERRGERGFRLWKFGR